MPGGLRVLILLAGTGALCAQAPVHIKVNEPRALAAALDQLENRLGVPIHYEDPR